MKRYHIGYSGRVGELYNPSAQWQDLGWTTAKDLRTAVKNITRRSGYVVNVHTILQRAQIIVFEVVK